MTSLLGTIQEFNSIVQRVSSELAHYRNEPLAARLRVGWVRARAMMRRMIMSRVETDNDWPPDGWERELTEDDAPVVTVVGVGQREEEVLS